MSAGPTLAEAALLHDAGQFDAARRAYRSLLDAQPDSALGHDLMEALSEMQRQVLGYYARIPATLEEWYQVPQRRMCRPGQG